MASERHIELTERTKATDGVRSGYTKLWGPARDTESWSNEVAEWSISTWGPSSIPGGLTLYATAGVLGPNADLPNDMNEFYATAGPDEPRLAAALSQVAAYAVKSGTALGAGHLVDFKSALWEGSGLRGFILTEHLELAPPVALEDGGAVHLLWALPLFPEELDFVRAEGTAAFGDLFEKKQIAHWNVARPNFLASKRGLFGRFSKSN